MKCVNLRERFGDRYKVRCEESYYADRGAGARKEDPWLMILLGRYGHIFPWGGTTLAASVDGHPMIAGRVRRMDCCRVVQDGDFGELTVAFDVEHFDRVAKVMRARRRPRRTLTPEQRARLADRMRRINRQRQLQRQSTAQERELVGSGP